MNKIPLKVLLGTGLGAAGGAAIAPKDEKFSSAIKGAFWGTLASGIGRSAGEGIRNLRAGKGFGKGFSGALKQTTWKEPVVGSSLVTGITAGVNKITGAYNPEKKNKNRLIRAIAPAADDLAMLGLAMMRRK